MLVFHMYASPALLLRHFSASVFDHLKLLQAALQSRQDEQRQPEPLEPDQRNMADLTTRRLERIQILQQQ